MSAIKDTPTTFRVYYKLFINKNKQNKEAVECKIKDVEQTLYNLKSKLDETLQLYKDKYNIDLNAYDEFVNMIYINGELYNTVESILKKTNALNTDLYILYDYANSLKTLNTCNNELALYNKCISIKLKDYSEILRKYYTQVHKFMIIDGYGYSFSNNIGWICINRCVLKNNKPMLDFAATKKRKQEAKANGEKIYNRKEAEWCNERNILYDAVDCRVFKTNSYCYEIPLLNSKLKNGNSLKFAVSDYRHSSLRGKTNNQIIAECNNDVNAICDLQVDLKTKLTLADKADSGLYLNFNRNENNQSYAYREANRKS